MLYKLLFLLSTVAFSGTIKSEIDFPKENCVAWKTKKTMFLVKKLQPVGVSCDAKFSLEKGEQPFLKIMVPIASFDSGEKKRDREVVKILKAEKQKDLIFKSSEAMEVYNSKVAVDKSVSGQLVIGGEEFPIEFTVSKVKKDEEFHYIGKSTLKYTDIGLKPPSVAGGAVAKVKNYLELHFRFSEGFKNLDKQVQKVSK